MGKCNKCNSELPAGVRFCPNCANPVGPVGTISGSDTISWSSEHEISRTPLEKGQEFQGRYVIKRLVGAGGMGVVYQADDRITNRDVALKLINPALVDNESARKRFIREGLIARDVRHQNVIAMYDVGESGDKQVYLVMEYLPGQTLRQWLHQKKEVKEEVAFPTAKEIIRNILEGLDAAHVAGVIHRDLKPENIVLTGNPENGDCRLKILDFGIARAIGADGAKQSTTTSSSTGTMGYMAPEQLSSADTAGPSADLYAVTAIFYELLMEVVPRGWPGSLSAQRPDLPESLDAVIEKGLRDRPRSRYQSAKEYLAALDSISATTTHIPKIEPGPKVQPRIAETPVPNPPDSMPKSAWQDLARQDRSWDRQLGLVDREGTPRVGRLLVWLLLAFVGALLVIFITFNFLKAIGG